MVSKLWLGAMGTTARISLCDSRLSFYHIDQLGKVGRKEYYNSFLCTRLWLLIPFRVVIGLVLLRNGLSSEHFS